MYSRDEVVEVPVIGYYFINQMMLLPIVGAEFVTCTLNELVTCYNYSGA